MNGPRAMGTERTAGNRNLARNGVVGSEKQGSEWIVGRLSLIWLRRDCPSLVHNARVKAEGANSIDGRLIYVFPSLVLLSAVEISSTGLP